METAAFLGMLGLGYALSNKPTKKAEGFKNSLDTNYEKVGKDTKPVPFQAPPPHINKPNSASKELDLMYSFPNAKQISSEPVKDKQGTYFDYSKPQLKNKAIQPDVKLDNSGYEKTPVLAKEKVYISPLSGVSMKPDEFKHANMVPFFRGSLKQNMADTSTRSILDNHTGSGFFQQEKREIASMFDPVREPTGVPYGSEIQTDFMHGRIVAPTNRAGETPFTKVRVGKGLGQGFTTFGSGGFHQGNSLDYAKPRTTDEIRTANNPKLTYEGVAIPGANFVTKPGAIGEVRKHNPDKFWINENGERNFTTTGANLKATERPVEVLRDTTRIETTREYEGIAKSADFNATYTVPSTRAPMVKQHGSWGYRNADSSNYGNKNTDADQNDYGKAGIEIRPNERFYTGERGQTLNPKPQDSGKNTLPLQDGPRQTRKDEMLGNPNQAGYVNSIVKKGMAYDPNDVMRTTIKETTIDNDYLGGASGPQKLTVYDPNDVARVTIKETTIDNDYLGTATGPKRLTVYDPNDYARKTVKETTIDNDYLGVAAGPNKQTVYDPTDSARVTIKETTIDNDYLGTAVGPVKLTIYDPNDVARTTIKETTIDNEYVGITAITGPQQLTVYDPDDIAKVTGRNTLDDVDYNRNFGRADNPDKPYLPYTDIARVTDREELSAKSEYYGNSDPNYPKNMANPFVDGVRQTQKAAISAKSAYSGNSYAEDKKPLVNPYMDGARKTQKAAISAQSAYTGSAGVANAKAPRSEGAERAMRQYDTKEKVAVGRKPSGNIAIFNGEDYINMKFNKVESDYINDRAPVVSRVMAEPPSEEIIGQQRSRNPLKLDVSKERMEPAMVSGLESNPYIIPLQAAGDAVGKKKVKYAYDQGAMFKN
jgi:hypothetical protein